MSQPVQGLLIALPWAEDYAPWQDCTCSRTRGRYFSADAIAELIPSLSALGDEALNDDFRLVTINVNIGVLIWHCTR